MANTRPRKSFARADRPTQRLLIGPESTWQKTSIINTFMSVSSKKHRTRFDGILEAAARNKGYFARAQLDPKLHAAIPYHESEGRIQRLARGIYRVVQYPVHEDEDYVIAHLWSSGRGVIVDESALSLHRISDVLPPTISLALPYATRQTPPSGIQLVSKDTPYPPEAVTWHDLVQVTTPWQTLLDLARRGVDPHLFEQAVMEATNRNLLPDDAWRRLLLAVVDR